MSAPREWSQERLIDLFPDVAVDPPAPVRCAAPARGEGVYIRGRSGERYAAGIKLEVEPADTLSARFEHEWPSECDAAEALDAAILKGIVDAIVHERPALRFGCVVTRSISRYEGSVTPIAFSIAAAMAMQDAARRAGWDPEPPTDDALATFGRLRA